MQSCDISPNKTKNNILNKIKILNDEKIKIKEDIIKLINKQNQNDEDILMLEKQLKNYKPKKAKNFEPKKEDISKEQIITLFQKNIKGKKYTKTKSENDGQEGQWLEKLMNIKSNASNTPDIGGYEMKKESKKISFGDWSGEYLFSQVKDLIDIINKEKIVLTKEQFMKYFGNKNKEKKDRYSWSGSCVPKYGKWNNCGQMLMIDEDNNILAMYSYNNDKRNDKICHELIEKEICIAVWSCKKMQKHVNDKFNQKEFFICKKNNKNEYDKICFGPPINHELFINKIKCGDIFFDSGMSHDNNKSNARLYQQWRASQKFWNNLIIEEF